jgi:hypothetical protein
VHRPTDQSIHFRIGKIRREKMEVPEENAAGWEDLYRVCGEVEDK